MWGREWWDGCGGEEERRRKGRAVTGQRWLDSVDVDSREKGLVKNIDKWEKVRWSMKKKKGGNVEITGSFLGEAVVF